MQTVYLSRVFNHKLYHCHIVIAQKNPLSHRYNLTPPSTGWLQQAFNLKSSNLALVS